MPSRKPLSQRIAEGDTSRVGKRKLAALAASEPKAQTGLGPCPRRLGKIARELWRLLADELASMNLDRRPDAAALEAVCVAYARAVEADEILSREGTLIERRALDKDSNVIVLDRRPHPSVSIALKSWDQYRRFAVEFGLTPASRSRLSVPKAPSTPAEMMSQLTTLLSGPRLKRPCPTIDEAAKETLQ